MSATISAGIALICFALFVFILANPKIPSCLTFFFIVPIALLTGLVPVSAVYSSMANNTLLLFFVVCWFAHLMGVSGLDETLGHFMETLLQKLPSQWREQAMYAILIVVAYAFSSVMSNLYVALLLLPVLNGINKKMGVSRSKLILITIFASTIGGNLTILGTPGHLMISGVLETAGYSAFDFFDFTRVGLPISFLSAIYMVVFHKFAPSYENESNVPVSTPMGVGGNTARLRQRRWVGFSFLLFLLALVVCSIWKDVGQFINPVAVGLLLLGLMLSLQVFPITDYIKGFPVDTWLLVSAIFVLVELFTSSGLGNVISSFILKLLDNRTEPYVIITFLFFGCSILNQFMNSMAVAGLFAPIGISLAEAMGVNPTAIMMTIALASTTNFLTPMGSAANQTLIGMTKLSIWDMVKFGFPIILISYFCCMTFIPALFPS